MRRFRWILLLVLVLIVGAVIASALVVRPDLVETRDRVDARWAPLRAPLAARYEALDGVTTALTDGGAGERAVTRELVEVLERWKTLSLRGARHSDLGAEAATADELEALARRARANVLGSAKLSANPAIVAAFAAFDQQVVAPPLVRSYNRAVRAYQDARDGTIESLVADALSFEPRPVLLLGT